MPSKMRLFIAFPARSMFQLVTRCWPLQHMLDFTRNTSYSIGIVYTMRISEANTAFLACLPCSFDSVIALQHSIDPKTVVLVCPIVWRSVALFGCQLGCHYKGVSWLVKEIRHLCMWPYRFLCFAAFLVTFTGISLFMHSETHRRHFTDLSAKRQHV
jgi:hypothetical protein